MLYGRSNERRPDMPRFYFDIDDGCSDPPDTEGCDMRDRAHARGEAVEALYNIAGETGKDISAVVRDDTHKVIFEAKLSLVSRWNLS